MLDYEALIKPYETNPDSEGTRTPGIQRAWLLKKGIPEDVADLAMVEIYTGLATGTTYESGRALDHALLTRAVEIRKEQQDESVSRVQKRINAAMAAHHKHATREEREARQRAEAERRSYRRPKTWVRHPVKSVRHHWFSIADFVLGVAAGAGGAWLVLTGWRF